MDSTSLLAIVAVVAVVAIAWLVFALRRLRETRRLKDRFGPEYRIVERELGSRAKAETELRRREKRVARPSLLALKPGEAARFSNAWARLQGSFVDDPKGVLVEADLLLRDLLVKRGYPLEDFDRRTADAAADHPLVVGSYRAAQAILSRDQRGEASTEDVRRAMAHLRVLFDELLGVTAEGRPVVAPRMAA
jgi:hypothetical protein